MLFLVLLIFVGAAGGQVGSSEHYCSVHVAGSYPDYYSEELPISHIRYDKLTDIIYFSITPNLNGTLNESTIDPTTRDQLIQMANLNNIRIWICVGGSGRSDNFSPVAANPAVRANFVDYLVQYCLTHGFDGVNLDWEPVSSSTDELNYTSLIRELKTEMTPHSLKLSVDVLALGNEFGPEAFDSIDWLYVMAYDMYKTDYHSTYEDAIAGLAHWESAGFPRPKMILGLPFFGRKIPFDDIYYSYKTIVDLYHPAPEVDEVNGINFNGINTIKAKTQYVMENSYGGISFWELTNDTMDETSLLTAAAETVHVNSPPDFNCDNVIDIYDVNYIMTNWLMTGCDAENFWCQRRDLDLSTTVDLPDYEHLALNWKQVLQGDINNDAHVDLQDIIALTDQWLWTGIYGGIPEDIYIDGHVNLKDFEIVAEYWLIQ